MDRHLLVACGLLLVVFADSSQIAAAQGMGEISIPVFRPLLDIDIRPDVDGLQYTMTAVRDIPSAVHTVVGRDGVLTLPGYPAGTRVMADLYGTSFGNELIPVEADVNQVMELPIFRAPGEHVLTNVRLQAPDDRK